MSRNREKQAQEAARQASEAGRILQAQRTQSQGDSLPQESESVEPRGDASERPAPRPRNDERDQAMAQIRQREMEQKGLAEPEVKPEMPQMDAHPETPPEQPATEAAAAQPAPEAGAAPETPAAEAAPEPIKTVRVKVDGEEFDAPQDDVEAAGGIKSYQIQKASENRLRKASETLAEARRMQEAIAHYVQQQQAPKTPQVSDAQFIASKLDAIRYGTPEEGAAALLEIQQRANPQIDQNALTNQAIMQINYQAAVRKFGTEFADVTANPLLMRLTQSLAEDRIKAMQNNPAQLAQLDWEDFYRRIGNEVRGVAPRSNQTAAAPTTTGPTSSVSSDKEARKSSIVTLPTAAARAALPEEAKPETRAESLNRIRKSRGLPTE